MKNNHLNTNKQFMIGNGILAFAVIFVVVIFVYMSMRLSQQKKDGRKFLETYRIELVSGFEGDSTSVYVNDSLLLNRTLTADTLRIDFNRFAEKSALMIVDNATERLSLFELAEEGGTYRFGKSADGEVSLRSTDE